MVSKDSARQTPRQTVDRCCACTKVVRRVRHAPTVTPRSIQSPDLEVGRGLVTKDLVLDRH